MEKGPEELRGLKYPAKVHCEKVKSHYLKFSSQSSDVKKAILLSGQISKLHEYSDQEQPFRQIRYFYYLSGVNIPGSHILYNFVTNNLTLILPSIDYDDIMWSGPPISSEQALKYYNIDEVIYVNNLESILQHLKSTEFDILSDSISETNSQYEKYLTVDDGFLLKSLDEARLIKDSYELALMRHASKITDNSHLAVMSALPIEKNEGHIHAEFTYHSIRQGSKNQSYDPICCSGENCSTLHYVKNDEDIGQRHSILIDAGAEWENYASDVTRCFPITGEWTKEHKEIYDIVLKMQRDTIDKIKPGVLWDDLHVLAHKILIGEFLKLGIFKGDESTIYDSRLSVSFFPHGLGHLLGLDTHDVGGNPNYEDPDPALRYLRLRRKLLPGMVLTDEPGVYFSPFLLADVLKDEKKMKFINKEVLDKYWYVGGVRIEDDLVVTKTGSENLTGITKQPEEISQIVKAGLARGADYFHNIV